MRDTWERRIGRAAELAEGDEAARALLLTYGRLLAVQRDCYEHLRPQRDRLSGSLDRDLPLLRPCVEPVLRAIITMEPATGAEEARHLLNDAATADAMLLTGWRATSCRQFLPKLLLQPYAELLAASGVRPVDRDRPDGKYSCPFCGGPPQVSILESAGSADGGGRQLLCATCSTVWPFRRLLCAQCGEEDERCLVYYHAPAFDHLRIDACDTCKHYLKTVDLTRMGRAVPVVDEVAAAVLDLWALEHGYRKIELNLMGL